MQSKQTLIKLKLWIIKARIPTLSERRESLSIKLFEDIVSNEHHKLANLLPPMASSHAWPLRNKRLFNTSRLDSRVPNFSNFSSRKAG